MNYNYLLALLAFPLVWPWIAKRIWHQTINWKEMGLQLVIPVLLITIVVALGRYGQTADTEVWNGQVIAKHRDHDYWLESYQCNCVSVSCGKDCTTQVCQTCFRDHYTVDWYLESTIGKIRLQYMDRTSKSVYKKPDPPQYTAAYKGEPCSKEVGYVNYIKAVPDSIFNYAKGSTLEGFIDLVPEYPQVHSWYKIDRVLAADVPDVSAMNKRLGEHLRTLGPEKEANIIVVIANTADQTYRHAIEEAWLGGKKNDIVVLIGASNYPTIDWVDTITLGANMGNSLMTVTMRDEIMKHKTLADGVAVIDTVASVVGDLFDRKAMDDFKYLEDEIEPPLWVIILALILGIGGSLGLTLLFHRESFFESRRYY